MHREKEYVESLRRRGLDEGSIRESLKTIQSMGSWLEGKGFSLNEPNIEPIEAWIAERLTSGEPVGDFLVPATRYFAAAREEAIAIRLMAYLLPVGILPAMADRLARLEGKATRVRVMTNVAIPAEGSPPESYPAATARFTEALETELGAEKARRTLTWNVHGISAECFAEERRRFLELGSVDSWLTDYHDRQVGILKKHAQTGTLWFEQKITPAVVNFVEARPEILGGVRKGDMIYVTKIPYDPDRFLSTKDSLERRRLACHCPLAAASITEGGSAVPSRWCACSAGFAKVRFDVVFGEETEALVLDSVLAGSQSCRFAVKIPPSISR